MNDQGLAWDCNSTTKGKLEPDPNPGKPYYPDHVNFLYSITKKAATVDEAIRIAKTYHFGEYMAGQYHIEDANGDAVVISAGPDESYSSRSPDNLYSIPECAGLELEQDLPILYVPIRRNSCH